jgi:hypothetical protein
MVAERVKNRRKLALEGKLAFGLQWQSEHLILLDTLGKLSMDKLGRNVTGQSSADKPLALTNRLHSG